MTERACGSRARYVLDRCRCERCRRANADYQRARSRAMRRPDEVFLPARVPAAAVAARLRELESAGIGLRRLAGRTGLSRKTLMALRSGRQLQVSRSVAERILAAE